MSDATFFASQDDTRLVAELREVTMDRDLDVDVDLAEVADIVSAHPTMARAMVNLHRRYRLTTTQLAAATEDRTPTAVAAGRSRCRKCATTSISGRTTCTSWIRPPKISPSGCGCTAVIWPATWPTGCRSCTGCTSSSASILGDTVLHRYDPASKTLEISTTSRRASRCSNWPPSWRTWSSAS